MAIRATRRASLEEVMVSQRSLFNYYADRRWGEESLDGHFRFRSLAYFLGLNDTGMRGDANEGAAVFVQSGYAEQCRFQKTEIWTTTAKTEIWTTTATRTHCPVAPKKNGRIFFST